MIRSSADRFLRLRNHFTLLQPFAKRARHEQIIQPDVRIPRRKRVALVFRMQHAKAVVVTSVEHELDRFALQLAATDPDQCFDPRGHSIKLENLTRRESVEVTDENVKAVLMPLDSFQ